VRDAARGKPRDIVGRRLTGFGQHDRSAADNGAQEYLKAAIAANVGERRPYRRRFLRATVGDDGAAKALKRVADDLRHIRAARCQHPPFGRAFGGRAGGCPHRHAHRGHQIHACVRPARRLVGDNGFDLAILDQRSNMIEIEIGRTEQHPPRKAVDFRHRDGGQQLIRDRKQHRAPGQLIRAADEASLLKTIGQRHRIPRVGDRTALQFGAQITSKREDLTPRHFQRPCPSCIVNMVLTLSTSIGSPFC